MLAGIFGNHQAVTGIAFPATSTKPEHTATPDNSYWPPHGKTLAATDAAPRGWRDHHPRSNRQNKTVNTRS